METVEGPEDVGSSGSPKSLAMKTRAGKPTQYEINTLYGQDGSIFFSLISVEILEIFVLYHDSIKGISYGVAYFVAVYALDSL
ncbi:hypothetical protein [Thermococcus sp.]|uniref:hypothetical protein n=1 Tax=Thermococcus sp. TaxID=35749 RepID=UPI00199219D9|nr:hypothetical protein [Thermococcus sp.]MBC7095016.1 hypothetical protein [Thermococcus sp.]